MSALTGLTEADVWRMPRAEALSLVCDLARIWVSFGRTDEQIAMGFGVPVVDIALLAQESRDFYDAITPPPALAAKYAEWQQKRAALSSQRRAYRVRRLVESPSLRIAGATRSRIYIALKGKTQGRSLGRLPYKIEQLMAHLEALFQPGMSWGNYGKWHVDHKRPCALFDQTNEAEFAECWALSNLQPLWAGQNLAKGARYAGS